MKKRVQKKLEERRDLKKARCEIGAPMALLAQNAFYYLWRGLNKGVGRTG